MTLIIAVLSFIGTLIVGVVLACGEAFVLGMGTALLFMALDVKFLGRDEDERSGVGFWVGGLTGFIGTLYVAFHGGVITALLADIGLAALVWLVAALSINYRESRKRASLPAAAGYAPFFGEHDAD